MKRYIMKKSTTENDYQPTNRTEIRIPHMLSYKFRICRGIHLWWGRDTAQQEIEVEMLNLNATTTFGGSLLLLI